MKIDIGISHLPIHFPNTHTSQGCTRPKPGARNSILGSSVGGRHLLLPKLYISRKLEWKLDWSPGTLMWGADVPTLGLNHSWRQFLKIQSDGRRRGSLG